MNEPGPASSPLSGEDLAMWRVDQPRQRTTMAMLMLLDRRPDRERLLGAATRALQAVPRMRQCVVEAPFDLALPRWEDDPTFDLDYHLRRYAQAPVRAGEKDLEALFRTVGPIYERPFDRTRPLWELIEIDRPHGRSALFFRLHHAMADGVGGNAVLAAMTDADREGEPLPPVEEKAPGGWPEPHLVARLGAALGHRAGEDLDRARLVSNAVWNGIREPGWLLHLGRLAVETAANARVASQSPLEAFGRSRHLSGLALDFEPLRKAKRALDGKMIDLLLSGVAGAMGRWHVAQGHGHVKELVTLVPINLRPPEEFGMAAAVGNRTTAVVVRLPIGIEDPILRFREIHRRMEQRKADPTNRLAPALAQLLAVTPRWLYRSLAPPITSAIDLIVTNVPGLPTPRYVAGARISAGYPIAPTAPHTPVSIALYGYHKRLYVGLDADGTAMTDVEEFRSMLVESFEEVATAAGV